MDLFERRKQNRGALGAFDDKAFGYFFFPILEGELSSRMKFQGKEKIVWSLNNYLGLGNHPEVRKVDADAARDYGLAYPMGSRMMTGNTHYHVELENQLSDFEQKEDTLLLNFGYQGFQSTIQCMVDRKDVIVYDSDCHACLVDGIWLTPGKRFVFQHNDMESCEKQLARATKVVEETGGGILVVTEGVFGMVGDQGDLKGIAELKKKYEFRLLVDDAHGFGTLGATGMGTGEEQGVQDEIDIYMSTFAKSMGSIGAFVSSEKEIINYLRYNNRSQIYAKSLPMPLTIGNIKRLEMLRNQPEHKKKLWENVNMLQKGLRDRGFNLGKTNSCVTPVYMEGGVVDGTNMLIDLRENYNIFCSIVVYPVVPKGVVLVRLIPTAMHSKEDIELTLEAFSAVSEKLKAGKYSTGQTQFQHATLADQ